MTTSLTIRPRRRSRCFPHFALTLISTTIFRRPPALGAASRRIGRCRRCRRCALPKTPLEETVLGLKVEVERLVEELDLLRSRSELSASAHRQAVVDHAVERSALVLQAAQKGELVALAKRDIKELTDELHTTCRNNQHEGHRTQQRQPPHRGEGAAFGSVHHVPGGRAPEEGAGRGDRPADEAPLLRKHMARARSRAPVKGPYGQGLSHP